MKRKIELKERKIIADGLSKGLALSVIAKELNVDRSTVHREVKRCTPYDPMEADRLANIRQHKENNPELRIKVTALHEAGLSKRKISRITGTSWLIINNILEGTNK